MDTQRLIRAIVDNVERVIVGKRETAQLMLIALLCEGHVLIEDVPGVGKTTLVQALARSVDCSYRRIQFTPDILPSDITGFSMYNQKTGEFVFKPGLVMSCFILADEINRTSPKTQASLLEVMEEGQVTVDGVTRPVGPPFMVMATQNPSEYVGTYPLPEAQVDRFFMRVNLGYPSADEEIAILHRFRQDNPLLTLKPVAGGADIIGLQRYVKQVFVADGIYRYLVDIVRGTREHPDVELGASPRGSLALYRASQALALLNGRDYVLPDDIKRMAPVVLNHRLILRREALLRHLDADIIIKEILTNSRVPINASTNAPTNAPAGAGGSAGGAAPHTTPHATPRVAPRGNREFP
ncbi:MAG: MoxR family ATPase [Oscillospiraceae bacterium]|nr:MoxR family ATPase [Oscillospiraceae bacterium]